ncbi:placenta-specific protein 9 isoform X1 [Trichosurus vulpecula]|uniref:placenta-specific protein 9 isoform X1 n=1 Tax=Trichosurus vulpecula TaxID=9337 RepID=UPI00186AD600|nr:placenta-specific protein 9 isoform X1 [Trichosurus vulpecula]
MVSPEHSTYYVLSALSCHLILKTTLEAAQPFRSSPGNADQWMKWCDEHKALHSRLDLVEETLDKTVEHLESEVKNLLNLMDAMAWNLPPDPGSPAENLFGDGGKLDIAGSCHLFSSADVQGELPAAQEEDAGGGEM